MNILLSHHPSISIQKKYPSTLYQMTSSQAVTISANWLKFIQEIDTLKNVTTSPIKRQQKSMSWWKIPKVLPTIKLRSNFYEKYIKIFLRILPKSSNFTAIIIAIYNKNFFWRGFELHSARVDLSFFIWSNLISMFEDVEDERRRHDMLAVLSNA